MQMVSSWKETLVRLFKKAAKMCLLFIWNKKIYKCCFQLNDNECSKVLMPSKIQQHVAEYTISSCCTGL